MTYLAGKHRSRRGSKKLSNYLPIAPLERIIKKSGAERVSESAASELALILQEKAAIISSKAIKLAKHAGRVTVTAEDIKMAR